MEADMLLFALVSFFRVIFSLIQPFLFFHLSKSLLIFSKIGKSTLPGLVHISSQEHPCLGVKDIVHNIYS